MLSSYHYPIHYLTMKNPYDSYSNSPTERRKAALFGLDINDEKEKEIRAWVTNKIPTTFPVDQNMTKGEGKRLKELFVRRIISRWDKDFNDISYFLKKRYVTELVVWTFSAWRCKNRRIKRKGDARARLQRASRKSLTTPNVPEAADFASVDSSSAIPTGTAAAVVAPSATEGTLENPASGPPFENISPEDLSALEDKDDELASQDVAGTETPGMASSPLAVRSLSPVGPFKWKQEDDEPELPAANDIEARKTIASVPARRAFSPVGPFVWNEKDMRDPNEITETRAPMVTTPPPTPKPCAAIDLSNWKSMVSKVKRFSADHNWSAKMVSPEPIYPRTPEPDRPASSTLKTIGKTNPAFCDAVDKHEVPEVPPSPALSVESSVTLCGKDWAGFHGVPPAISPVKEDLTNPVMISITRSSTGESDCIRLWSFENEANDFTVFQAYYEAVMNFNPETERILYIITDHISSAIDSTKAWKEVLDECSWEGKVVELRIS